MDQIEKLSHTEVYKEIKYYLRLLGEAVEDEDMPRMSHLVDMMDLTIKPVTDALGLELYTLVSIGDNEGAIALISQGDVNPLDAIKVAEDKADYATALALHDVQEAANVLTFNQNRL